MKGATKMTLKISVFTKNKGNLVRIFKAEDIHQVVDKMASAYGDDHAKKYEIEIERVKS